MIEDKKEMASEFVPVPFTAIDIDKSIIFEQEDGTLAQTSLRNELELLENGIAGKSAGNQEYNEKKKNLGNQKNNLL